MANLKNQLQEALQCKECWYELDPEGATVMDYPHIENMVESASKVIEQHVIEKLIEENESILAMLRLHSDNERVIIPVKHRIETLKENLNKLKEDI